MQTKEVVTCFRGAFPPVNLLGGCLILAILLKEIIELWGKWIAVHEVTEIISTIRLTQHRSYYTLLGREERIMVLIRISLVPKAPYRSYDTLSSEEERIRRLHPGLIIPLSQVVNKAPQCIKYIIIIPQWMQGNYRSYCLQMMKQNLRQSYQLNMMFHPLF